MGARLRTLAGVAVRLFPSAPGRCRRCELLETRGRRAHHDGAGDAQRCVGRVQLEAHVLSDRRLRRQLPHEELHSEGWCLMRLIQVGLRRRFGRGLWVGLGDEEELVCRAALEGHAALRILPMSARCAAPRIPVNRSGISLLL